MKVKMTGGKVTSVEEKIKAVLDRECKARIQDGYKNCPRTYVGMDCAQSYVDCYLCHQHDALARELAEINNALKALEEK